MTTGTGSPSGQAVRIAVVSDTHLPRRARRLPDRLVEECRAADLVLHAGDFVGFEVLAELRAYGDVAAVHGNVDEEALVRLLPETRVVEAAGLRIGMVHDAGPRQGRPERLAARFPGCGVVVYGHSHQPAIERHGGLLLLNPGSAIDRRCEPVATMAVLRVDGGHAGGGLIELPG